MSLIPNSVYKLLQALAAVCVLALGMVFICSSTAGVVMIQLLAAGWNKYIALGIGIVTAFFVGGFITFNHKIREWINYHP